MGAVTPAATLTSTVSNFPSRLTYKAGLENAPGDPFGRTELHIEADSRARLVHRHVGRERSWTAKIDAATLITLWAALRAGGFPEVARHPIPGGSAMRTVSAQDGEREQSVNVAWNSARSLPGYNEAFAILDSIVRQMSEDTVKAAPNTLPPVVTELVRDH